MNGINSNNMSSAVVCINRNSQYNKKINKFNTVIEWPSI